MHKTVERDATARAAYLERAMGAPRRFPSLSFGKNERQAAAVSLEGPGIPDQALDLAGDILRREAQLLEVHLAGSG